MEGYVNKEVCVNIELVFLLVFVHEKSPRRALQLANECLMVSYGFLPSILQVWVAEGWQGRWKNIVNDQVLLNAELT